MGLSIYFCDVCGTRITDADLRSGHGMLQRFDAICAGCIDLGHGKAWLEARQAAAKAPSDPAIASPEHLDKKDTVRLRTDQPEDFRQAAVAMGAMATAPTQKEPAATLDELPETDAPTDDTVGEPEAKADVPTDSLAKDPSKDSGKGPRPTKKSTPAKAATGKSATSRTPTPSTSKGRAPRGPAPGNARRTQIITTLVGVSVIIACGLYMMDNKGVINLRGPAKPKTISMAAEQDNLLELIRTTRAQVDSAFESNDKAKMKAAHEAILKLRQSYIQFGELAVKGGWSDSDVASWANSHHIVEALDKDRLLRDRLVISP